MNLFICLLTLTELSNALIIGVVASLIAAFLAILFERIYQRIKLKNKYIKIVGIYHGYRYENKAPKFDLIKEPWSKAEINYIEGNKLKIIVSDLTENSNPENIWIGIISMELEDYGTIAWHYKKYHGENFGDKNHEFGFKRLIVNYSNNNIFIYVLNEINETRYPIEIFKKQ